MLTRKRNWPGELDKSVSVLLNTHTDTHTHTKPQSTHPTDLKFIHTGKHETFSESILERILSKNNFKVVLWFKKKINSKVVWLYFQRTIWCLVCWTGEERTSILQKRQDSTEAHILPVSDAEMPQDTVISLGLAESRGLADTKVESCCWLLVIVDVSHKISELRFLTCEMGIILIGLVWGLCNIRKRFCAVPGTQ